MVETSYMALALQLACQAVNRFDAAGARARMRDSIARIQAQIVASKRFIGPDVRLVVLPEYFLTGFPMGEGPDAWAEKAALDMDGPEYATLGEAAAAADVYLSGNTYERDPHFPGLYFQTCFVIAPDRRVVLRYRRLISMFAPSPYDVLDRYLSVYGRDGLFPVVETEIGRLAAIASEEILYPEIARAHALKGAEIFLHSSSEVASPLATPKNVAKLARAIENQAYLVSANSAGVQDVDIPAASTDAASKIIDYRGIVLAEAGYGESMVAFAPIDLTALRRWRRRPGMGNMPARLPLSLFAEAYAGGQAQQANGMIGADGAITPPSGPTFYRERQLRVIEALDKAGVI